MKRNLGIPLLLCACMLLSGCTARQYYSWRASNSSTAYWQYYYYKLAQGAGQPDRSEEAPKVVYVYPKELGSFVYVTK